MRSACPETLEFDVVVVGAGAAGAAAARLLARRGRRVALTDVRDLGRAGARWVNGVPPWMFDAAGVPRPEPPERRAASGPFTILGPDGRRRLRLEPNPVWSVDMRLLVARLQDEGRAAGATLFGRAAVVGLECAGVRPTALVIEQRGPGGERVRRRLAARLFVDASGMAGVIRRRVPLLDAWCPKPARAHVCTAAQEVCRVTDPAAARSFLRARDARPGETLCRLGVAGGYSTANICVEPGFEAVELLTGAIAEPRYPDGGAILRDLRAHHPWIGPRLFGGAGAIPLRRPYDRLSAPGVALLGNAACQVFSAHGSGIGIGLVAARLLADAVADAGDPGAPAVTWAYQAAFHRRFGGLLAAYDLLRRLSQTLEPAEIDALLASGLLGEAGYRAGLDQRLPPLDPATALATVRGVLRAPRVARRLLPVAARMPAALALYRRHPARPDERALARWSSAVARLFGDRPDVPA